MCNVLVVYVTYVLVEQSGTQLLHHVLEWRAHVMCKVEVRLEEM